MSQKEERRNNKKGKMQDKKIINTFPVTLDSLCRIRKVHGQNAKCISGRKVWWLGGIVICEVSCVSVRIYFISERKSQNDFVATRRTVESKAIPV
jgi:hypothetical protein